MLALVGMYLLIHLISVYVGFSLTKMDQTRSRRYFPLAAGSALAAGLLHHVITLYAGIPDRILEGLLIGAGTGLCVFIMGLIMLPRVRTKVAMVAAVVCFGDLAFSMVLLR
ncbi:MAG: hypothetical protein R3F46_15325 [bacterium]